MEDTDKHFGYRVLIDGEPRHMSWYLSSLYAQEVFNKACQKTDAGTLVELIKEYGDGSREVKRTNKRKMELANET